MSLRQTGHPTSRTTTKISSKLRTQSKIGWHLVKYGFLALEWKTIQHEWASERDPYYCSNKTERWTRRVQEAMWKYVADVWENRNNIVHGKTKEEVKQRKLMRLRKQARGIL